MKSRRPLVAIAALVLLVGALVIAWRMRASDDEQPPATATRAPTQIPELGVPAPATQTAPAAIRDPLPGQGRARVELVQLAGGSVSGRVIDASTGDGIAGAELTFTSGGNAVTVRSVAGGGFELAPSAPGRFVLSAVSAPGFLPYAPELMHSTVQLELARDRAVRGITVFLFPAGDYRGRVVDARGEGVAGARVRLLGAPSGEQAIERLDGEWTADRRGEFTFHAADEAILEATHGTLRGWARVDNNISISKRLTITIGDAPARDATITGRVVDTSGAAIMRETDGGGASAQPSNAGTVTRTDGTFELTGLPAGRVSITISADGFHPRIEAGMTAVEGGELGPVTIVLNKLRPGEEPKIEVVGIGVSLAADGDALRVTRVIAGGGAEAAGIVVGDRIIAVDGGSTTQLGLEGIVARIRGVAGTTVAITIARGDKPVTLVVERRKLRA